VVWAPLKGSCLVLVIEWQPRWTNCVQCEIHRWLVHMCMCVSNICHGGENGSEMLQSSHMWWRSSLHMRHDIESCDQDGEDQNKAWLDGPVASVKGKLWGLSADGPKQRWRTSKVKIDEPIWSCDDMKWIISFVIDWCMCCINIRGNGMECAKQRHIYRAFHFTSHRCVEKFITGFRIDGRTIKRGKFVCISVI
jgi:hypothetical protein